MTIQNIFNELSKREFELFEKWSNTGCMTVEEIAERKQCDDVLHFLNKKYGFTLSNCKTNN